MIGGVRGSTSLEGSMDLIDMLLILVLLATVVAGSCFLAFVQGILLH